MCWVRGFVGRSTRYADCIWPRRDYTQRRIAQSKNRSKVSFLSPQVTPPEDSWDTLREWRMQRYGEKLKIGFAVAVRLITLVVGLAGVALLIAEPSSRTLVLIAILWAVGVPLAAIGYVRKMDRMAARVPISPASTNPTTAVDIGASERR